MNLSAPQVGFVLVERYALERRISADDTGPHIFLARDRRQSHSPVIIRFLAGAEALRTQFGPLQREYSILRTIRHPQLSRVIDLAVCSDLDRAFLVEESCEGPDLLEAANGWNLDQRIMALIAVAGALQHLHSHGVIHGCLIPGGIRGGFKTPEDLKVGIYGLTRHGLAGQEAPTAWSAPEVILGAENSARSDIYSLGALAYQLLSGRPPFEPDSQGYLAQKQLQAMPDMQVIENLDSGKGLAHVLRLMLDKGSDRRPASADEVVRLLSAAVGRDLTRSASRPMWDLWTGTPFVGRKQEMERLQAVARRIRQTGRGNTVFIAGEPGIGKTRLLEEFRTWALLDGWLVTQAACHSHDGPPYSPFRQVLEGPSPEEAGPDAMAHPPFAFSEEPGDWEVSGWLSTSVSGPFRDRLTREIVRRLSGSPSVLLLHDFHRADEATAGILDFLAADIMAHPILVCVSYRPQEAAGGSLKPVVERCVRHERCEILNLEPMPEEEIRELICAGVSSDEAGRDIAAWIAGAVGGNPFFAEEILKHLADRGALRAEGGAWRFNAPLGKSLGLPDSILHMLRQRISRLSEDTLSLARWLALLKRPAPESLLPAGATDESGGWSSSAGELMSRGLARLSQQGQQDFLSLSHDLVAELIANDIPPATAKQLHAEIARRLERQGAGPDALQELAWHLMQGEGGEKPARMARRAAEACRAQYANEPARRFLEYAIRNRKMLAPEEFQEAILLLAAVYRDLNLAQQSVRLVREHLRKLPHNASAIYRARLYLQLSLSFQHLGRMKQSETTALLGSALLKRTHHDKVARIARAYLLAQVSFCRLFALKIPQAVDAAERGIKTIFEFGDMAITGHLMALRGASFLVGSNIWVSKNSSMLAIQTLERHGQCHWLASAHAGIAVALQALGRSALAITHGKLAFDYGCRIRSIPWMLQGITNLVEIHRRFDSGEATEDLTRRMEQLAGETANPDLKCNALACSAEIKIRRGEYSATADLLKRLAAFKGSKLSLFSLYQIAFRSAWLSQQLGDWRAAWRGVAQCRRIRGSLKMLMESQPLEFMVARLLLEEGKDREALRVVEKLCLELRAGRLAYHLCGALLLKGKILRRMGRLGDAGRELRSAMRLARVIPLPHAACEAGIEMARVCMAGADSGAVSAVKGAFPDASPGEEAANRFLRQALQLARDREFHELAWVGYWHLAQLDNRAGRRREACENAARALDMMSLLDRHVPPEFTGAYRHKEEREAAEGECLRILRASAAAGMRDTGTDAAAGIRALFRASDLISEGSNSLSGLQSLASELLRAASADRAAIFILEEGGSELTCQCGIDGAGKPTTLNDPRARMVAELCLRYGSPILSGDATRDERLRHINFRGNPPIGMMLAGPLSTGKSVLGVLYADRQSSTEALSESLVNLFALFCRFAAVALEKTLQCEMLLDQKKLLEAQVNSLAVTSDEIVGISRPIRILRESIRTAADSTLDILITGESGSGKELVARALHRQGRRASGKFVAIDCGALTDSLAESEFFGYRKGSFTGAYEDRAGLLESADRGTLFLDELSNLSLKLQGKLLRVVQEREFRRIGETRTRKIEVQIIAATNRDLEKDVSRGRFRKDLYYRLRGMIIQVPALRERPEDIPLLLAHFLGKTSSVERKRRTFSPAAMEMLRRYHYPGNVRELAHIVQQSFFTARAEVIDADSLPPEVRGASGLHIPSFDPAGRKIYEAIRSGQGCFEALAKKPFLQREISAGTLRNIMALALADAEGRYREAFRLLRIRERDYPGIMIFLKRHRCSLDFRPYRKRDRSE